MATHGKKWKEAAKAVDASKAYPINEAVALLKKSGYSKFDGSVEIAVKTFADAKYNDQMMRGTTILPHGTGKTKKIAVFTDDEATAKKAGADIAGTETLLNDIKAGKLNFDVLLTTPEHIRDLAPVAKQLGPK
jgi:large subunit ribosomal protein L1